MRRVYLGAVASEVAERSAEIASPLPVYGVDRSVGLTQEPRYQAQDLSRYKIVRPGMFAYNPMRLNIGSIGYCHNSMGAGLVSPDYIVFKCDERHLRPQFFQYHTKSKGWSSWLSSAGEGSVRERIYFRKLATYDFQLPGLRYQDQALELLSSLDSWIELNRQESETVEAMVQAIFRDWFVDFGPTRRKLDGATDPTTVIGGLTSSAARAQELADYFPDTFGDHGLPAGWTEETLLDQANWVNGAAYKNMHFSDEPNALPVIKIAELKAGVTDATKRTATALGDKYRIRDGELLFSWSGNPDTSIDAFVWTGSDAWLNQHIFAVRGNGRRSYAALYATLKYLKPQFAELARNKQTTGLGHVTKDDMKRIIIASAPRELTGAFDQIVGPMFESIMSKQFENRNLIAIRDVLLPKLVSGEIRLREAEEMLEAAQ